MSTEKKSFLITIVIAIITAITILSFGGAVNAASPQKVLVYHRDGSVETFRDIVYVKSLSTDSIRNNTSIVEMKSGDKIYIFYDSEVRIEKDCVEKII